MPTDKYNGMLVSDAVDAATIDGVERIRVLESVDGVTVTRMQMDLRPSRLNLVVENGRVIRGSFF